MPSHGIWFTRPHKSTYKVIIVTPNKTADTTINLLYQYGNYNLNHSILDAANKRDAAHINITLKQREPNGVIVSSGKFRFGPTLTKSTLV